MEILKQIAENSVLVLSLAEINSGVEVCLLYTSDAADEL